MDTLYRSISTFTGVLFVYLWSQLLFCSTAFVAGLGLEPSVATSVLCRRTSMFMLGLAVLMFAARRWTASSERLALCAATGITLLGLSAMGAYELANGRVNSSIVVAIITESVIWMSLAAVAVADLGRERASVRAARSPRPT